MSKYTDLAILLETAARALREADKALTDVPVPGRTDIDCIGLSTRTRRLLARAGIVWLETLTAMSAIDLLEFDGCGGTTVIEIRCKLAESGLYLRGEAPPCEF